MQGAQILNDSAGIFYPINQNGSGWIQMDSNGNIDIRGEGNITRRKRSTYTLAAT